MNTEALEKHIIDTVKEWQMKIGYRNEEMNLYYPDVSLAGLLEIPDMPGEEELYRNLECFADSVKDRLGKIRFSNKGERYCLTIPAEGCTYIHTQIPDSEFLKLFLTTITGRDASMDRIRECFERTASEKGESFVMTDREADGMGQVFYFAGASGMQTGGKVPESEHVSPENSAIDEYVYCVESDDFGMTYHRFSWPDYRKLISEDHEERDHAETCVMCQ